MKDKKAFIFYFLMSLIFLDFANQIRIISYNPQIVNIKNPVFSIVHINNTGSAFSMFQNDALFLAVFGIFVIIYITFYVYKHICFNDKFALLAMTLFCSGCAGNLIERLKYGYVVDYIKLNFINFPVFNSYDILICLGILLYLVFVLFDFNFKKAKNESD